MQDPSIIVGASAIPNIETDLGVVPVGPAPAIHSNTNDPARDAPLSNSKLLALAATVEIQTELDSFHELDSAANKAAQLLRQSVNAAHVLIAWRKREQSSCELVATTIPVAKDQNSLIVAAAEEIIARGMAGQFPPRDHTNRHALLAVAKYAEAIRATSILAEPLIDRRGNCLGVVLVVDVDPAESEFAQIQLSAAGTPVATKLAMIQAMQPRKWERVVRGLTGVESKSRRKVILSIGTALLAALLVPVHYQVSATCELRPVVRRIVAAPFDGPLETVHIRPGDLVESGQTLARLNPREINYELAGLRAELKQAVQEQKGMVAKHDFGASKIAKLETDRIRLEQELLRYQRENLEIRSPLAGMVVSGDWKESEGAPLTKGETMFEIAPLDKLIVEVAIPEEDIVHVRESMSVQFYLHAVPNERLIGTIHHIHPKAELRQHENVFIAEVTIKDDSGVLRPGMQGRARIQRDRHTLGWNVFHKAFYTACNAIGW